MPKKPKHIQEKVDQLLREGYTAKEIIKKMKDEEHKISSSYISSRRKKAPKLDEKKETPKTSTSPNLSRDSIQLLFNLQGILGKENLEDTIKTISEDYRAIIQEKYRYDLDNKKSAAEVFTDFKEVYRLFETLDKNDSQLKLLEKMEPEIDPLPYYRFVVDDKTSKITVFEFLIEYAVKYWRDVEQLSIIRVYLSKDDTRKMRALI